MYTRRYIFYSGLDMESALELGVAAGGWFACVNPMEEREILDGLLENSFSSPNCSEPRQEESTLSHESFSTHGSKLSPFTLPYSSVGPFPEPRIPKEEEIQPLEFSSRFEDDPSGNIRNTSNLGTRSLRNRCVLMRHSIKSSAIHPQWIGQRRQSVLPKQFRLAQPLQASLVL